MESVLMTNTLNPDDKVALKKAMQHAENCQKYLSLIQVGWYTGTEIYLRQARGQLTQAIGLIEQIERHLTSWIH